VTGHEPREVTLRIPMLPDMELAASQVASSVAVLVRLTVDEADEVRLAIIEACLNAFEHSQSPDRSVTIRYVILPDELKIIIEDEGKGFSPEHPPERPQTSQLEIHPRGWGLKLMRELMDEVRIESSAAGTKVILSKRLQRDGGEEREAL